MAFPGWRRVAAGVAVVGMLAGLWAGWSWWRRPVVEVWEVQHAPLVRSLQFSARVATLSRVELGSTLTARVARVRVREGDTVRQGDVLLELESDEPRAALAQADASTLQAQARLAGLRSTGRSAAQAAVAQAQASQRAAEAELQRAQQLVAQGFVSGSRLDDARRAVEVARAQAEGAQAQAQALQDQGSDLEQARAQLAQATASAQAARVRLAQTQVRAPADARVLTRLAEPGQIVQPGRALLALALVGPTQLVAQVDERFLAQLQPGQAASVVADAFATQRMAARVLRLAPIVDAQRGAVEVRLTLDQPPPSFLREDMTLSVEVETARRARALAVPVAALRDGQGDGATVYLAAEGRLQPRPVRLGLRTLDTAEVLEGLAPGDQVASAASPVAPGTRVRVRPVARAPQPAAAGAAQGGNAGAALSQAMGR